MSNMHFNLGSFNFLNCFSLQTRWHKAIHGHRRLYAPAQTTYITSL